MTGLSCAQLAEVADELALDVLPGDVRSLALAHLDECPSCRATVEGLSETADALLFAHGAIEPPEGFAQRVLERLADEPTVLRRRPRRRLLLTLAAAAVVAVLIGVGFVTLRSGTDQTRERHLRLVSSGGQVVGDVSAYAGRQTWFFIRVDDGVASGTYQCVLDMSGGQAIHIGSLTVTAGKGAWGESLSVGTSNVRDARLVTADGTTIATASFR